MIIALVVIAFIIDSFPALSESFIHNQIKGMMDKGHTVLIYPKVIREGGGWKVLEKYDIEKNVFLQHFHGLDSFFKALKVLVASYLRLEQDRKAIRQSLNPIVFGWDAITLNQFRFILPFLGKHIDLLYCHYGTNGVFAAQLKKSGIDLPIITMFHGYDIRLGIEKGGGHYHPLFSSAHYILSISEYNKQQLLSFGCPEEKLVDLKIGIDTDRFRPNPRSDESQKLTLLSVGRLKKAKGYTTAIEAIASLPAELQRRVEYLIIGAGEDEQEFKELVENYGLTEIIRFVGGIPNSEIHHYYQQADIFIHPSYAEALPVVIMEAQSMALPVIATDVGSVNELVENERTGMLIQPGDVQALTDSLIMLIKDSELRKRLCKRARQKIIAQHNLHTQNQKLEELFYCTLNG